MIWMPTAAACAGLSRLQSGGVCMNTVTVLPFVGMTFTVDDQALAKVQMQLIQR